MDLLSHGPSALPVAAAATLAASSAAATTHWAG
jgi:hypothetical protein